ncbi:MAG TPA: condensation domain-containing protein [Pseudonocardiaceae bacterium]
MTSEPMVIPSSPAQEALWWIQHRTERKDLYNLTWRMRVTDIDPAVLRRAWQLLVDRHEALRTAFARRADTVVQLVHPMAGAELSELYWPAAPAGISPDALLDELATAVHAAPFDLGVAPLARATLVGVGARQELILTVHHAVLDGWALHLIGEELETAYLAVRDRGPELAVADVFPAPPISYREFAQRRHGDDATYWLDRLRGARSATLWPDRPTEAHTGTDGAVLRHRQSREVAAAVTTIANRIGATPFAVQLAAVRSVLFRGGATGRTALGVVVANRMTAQDQARIGYCANVVLLPDEVTATDTLDDVATRCRDSLWGSLPYQHVGYPEVFAALPASDRAELGATPPVLVTHHGQIGAGLTLGGAPAELLPSLSISARCQLLLGFFEDGDRTTIEVEYDSDRYHETTVRTLLADLDRALLASAGPATSIGELSVRSRALAGAAALVGDTPDTRPALPVTEPADELLAIWRRVLGVPVAPSDDFFRLGGHSLQVLQLIGAVEASIGRPIDVADWLDEPTPARLAELATNDPTVAVVPRGTGPQVARTGEPGAPHVHLVHGAGVGRLPYRDLVDALPTDWRVTVSEDDHGTDGVTIEELASRYLAELSTQDKQPDLLVGWSMGGLVVHAMAAELCRRGLSCPPVVLLDSPTPVDSPVGDAVDVSSFVESVLRSAGAETVLPGSMRFGDSARHGIDALVALLRLAGTDAPSDALHERFALYRAHRAAIASYRGDPVVDTPALLVTADLDEDEIPHWARRFAGGLRSMRLDTDHYGLLRGANARRLADLLGRELPVRV